MYEFPCHIHHIVIAETHSHHHDTPDRTTDNAERRTDKNNYCHASVYGQREGGGTEGNGREGGCEGGGGFVGRG